MIDFYHCIKEPLENELKSPGGLKSYDWINLQGDALKYLAQEQDKEKLHKVMKPYYEELIEARGCRTHMPNESYSRTMFVWEVFEHDPYVPQWIWQEKNLDICKLTDMWIDAEGVDANAYKRLLKCLTQSAMPANWNVIKNYVFERLKLIIVENQYRQDKDVSEFYCSLHAFCVIMESSSDEERNGELFGKFLDHWVFIRYMYSVMMGHIIGSRLANIVAMANVVENTPGYAPYLHLFYAPLKERFEQFCLRGAKRDKLLAAIKKIEKKMQETERSEELDELCELLFSKKFLEMLERNRPKSYRELESEISRIKEGMGNTISILNGQIQELAEKLSNAVKASVPIDEIETELMKFQSRETIEIYKQLGTLLVANPAWQARAQSIRDKILDKQRQEMTISMQITANAGANVNGIVQQQTNHALGYNSPIGLA